MANNSQTSFNGKERISFDDNVGMSSTTAFAQEPVTAVVEQNAAGPDDESSIFTMEDVHRRFRLMAAANLDEHFLDMLDDDLIFDLMEFPGMREQGEISFPSYPMGEARNTTCQVCLETRDLTLRPCCDFPACSECLKEYITIQVSEANVKVQCPSSECKKSIHRDEIFALLDANMRTKFNQFLINVNCFPHQKTCPSCNHITTIDLKELADPVVKKMGFCISCDECDLKWCFPCQSPWHEPLTCKDFQLGDKLFRSWAKEHHHGQVNAQKCPKCKIYIQRTTGCDHMTCSKCNTEFCYRCGEKFRGLKFVGNHHSRFSIFGCKYRFKPGKPVQRKFIRGSIFGAKLLATPVLGGLAIGAGAVIAGAALVVLPFYGSYKLYQLIQRKREKGKRNEQKSQSFESSFDVVRNFNDLTFDPNMLEHDPFNQHLDIMMDRHVFLTSNQAQIEKLRQQLFPSQSEAFEDFYDDMADETEFKRYRSIRSLKSDEPKDTLSKVKFFLPDEAKATSSHRKRKNVEREMSNEFDSLNPELSSLNINASSEGIENSEASSRTGANRTGPFTKGSCTIRRSSSENASLRLVDYSDDIVRPPMIACLPCLSLDHFSKNSKNIQTVTEIERCTTTSEVVKKIQDHISSCDMITYL